MPKKPIKKEKTFEEKIKEVRKKMTKKQRREKYKYEEDMFKFIPKKK